MLRISDISYSIAGRPLFEGASAVIPEGHKVGLIGANGTGKTTLFKLIRRELVLEGGSISLPSKARIGGVAQEVPASSTSLLDTVLAADTERAELMADDSTDPTRIAEIQTRLADIDAWSAEARAATILKGLGFDDAEQLKPCSDFSGGWRMRVALAAVLFSQPDLLLLDEPTNYLDLEGALWLEAYLAKYPHTVIIISHDRGLLNRAVGAILHLEERQLTYYSGPYDQFARQRAERRAVQAAMAKKQQARREHMQSFVDRFKAKASKAKQAQSRLKMIEKMDMIAAPEEAAKRVFTFPEPEELSPPIINIEGGTTGYGDTVILSKLNLRIDQDDRIALLGKNGQGKSTLSKLLSDRLPLMSGKATRSTKLRIGYFAQHQVDELHIDETPLQHIQSLRPGVMQSKLRATLAGFGLGPDQADTAVGRLSGGQKARLSLLLATIDAPHLLILDEPTNHLDIESREALVEALTAYTGAVILVSHDMHLLGLVADRLWLVSNGTVQPYDEDLEAYRKMLLSADKPAKPAKVEAPKAKRPSREKVLELRAEARKSEARVDKLNEMRDKLAKKLADPALYDDSKKGEAEVWQKKYAEVMNALDRAEAMWMAALEKLEGADAV
ncbi:ABC-F family ATP-binding cassette domain-containing protein [Sulfitobacter pseudonitzschiae]|uniref:ABC-F family ATP-binding cassette domain-containing protein n=1 Tax=Pseudosulfitobacter pseudonitzschiae TaxID=1402135 RepID=A0A9Q2NFL6_9RHOB|nr:MULTISPECIES: ABC-F family ATP-binding cassette domain-containing protein [Roseobacteraceae]MBM2290983.1 ABC-F family ATP-binding cassette domain-containing protein [Pseudosulfitobacter pseudonitzschiae]MBM2295901.1 ABC-F family ATP-binding cassette domain-containing protein [Pseudosulfitobacter pseudonitzschiae]MBM2300814.1 ABC-F family ATP-binding cassette domain-containing protein [Pseudosulfitobacter pseudonitzschiae]MBM2310598.1 ABC-F family ATP-binding cassette domain-containing protei|tara:strand:+ start:15577 stop:17424 length:1848 start_codon:yes stop_codon:yes gene_type:complete